MHKRPARATPPALMHQAAEMALAVPQVVQHRVTRMALAGALPTASDREEFHLMGTEKVEAFQESWAAMAAQAWASQQTLAASMMNTLWAPLVWRGKGSAHDIAEQFQHSAIDVLHQGMAPLHRRAMANARRLASDRL